jgi:hypothetical protein
MTTVMMDLKADAIAEVKRLTMARAACREGDRSGLGLLDADGPWITRARRPNIRRALGRNVLLLWRVACADTAGRVVDARLVASVVALSAELPMLSGRGWIRALLQEVDAEARALVDASVAGWREAVEAHAQAFAAARLSRERAIASRGPSAHPAVFQPGLFDRRAEQTRQLEAAIVADAERERADRLAAVVERTTAAARRPELLLVLIP